jgi:hypothetical protein
LVVVVAECPEVEEPAVVGSCHIRQVKFPHEEGAHYVNLDMLHAVQTVLKFEKYL